jgi:hypothetical protein
MHAMPAISHEIHVCRSQNGCFRRLFRLTAERRRGIYSNRLTRLMDYEGKLIEKAMKDKDV